MHFVSTSQRHRHAHFLLAAWARLTDGWACIVQMVTFRLDRNASLARMAVEKVFTAASFTDAAKLAMELPFARVVVE